MAEQEPISSNSRIAKNTLALYVRMFISMIIGLYTSRVVLATLGVEDYGIYGVVGGVVAMLGFLNSSMSGATSRFLTFELGKGDRERLAKTFSSALIIHVGIALVVLVIAETAGLWFLCNKLVIPESRMTAAHWVYQLSIASAMLGITQVPYNATIIAHERMGVYAYVEILNSVLKLLIVYLLVIGNFDKLILYAVLMFAVSVIILMIYRIYCIRHFKESHFHWIWDKRYLYPMLSFSGWNIYGNFGSVARDQGTNFVINNFFGVAMNAAVSVGLTVANIVNLFASNIMTAFRPPITKQYAQGNISRMQDTTLLAMKVILLIYCMVAIPTFAESDYLLKLWLVEVPPFAGVFCRLLLVSIFFETIRYIINIDIHASGNVRLISAFTGTFCILVPFVVYVLYRLGLPPQTAFWTFIGANILLFIANIFVVKHYIPQIQQWRYVVTILHVIAVCGVVLFATWMLHQQISEHFGRLLITTVFAVLFLSFLAYYFCFDKVQRKVLLNFIKSKLHVFH